MTRPQILPGDTQEARLLGRAMRWPISHEKRVDVVDRLHAIVTTSDNERAVAAAANALMKADALNLQAEHGPQGTTVNVGIQVNQELPDGTEQRAIDLIRAQLVAEDTGAICQPDQPETLEAGPPPGIPRPTGNGSRNGQNGKHHPDS